MINRILVIDTETTGTNPEVDGLLEVAGVCVEPVAGRWEVTTGGGQLIRWDGPIPPEARAVHHIAPKDVGPDSDAMERSEAIAQMLAEQRAGDAYAAHNAPFDMGFLPELVTGEYPWIDTYQCAKHLIPDAPKYGNQVLRYYLDLEPKADFLEGLDAHRALFDTACTAELLVYLLGLAPPDELLRLSTLPVLQTTCTFGKKHAGQPWSEVPKSYLRWMINDSDLKDDPIRNRDILYTARHYYEN